MNDPDEPDMWEQSCDEPVWDLELPDEWLSMVDE